MKEIKASKSEIDYLRQKFEQAQNDLKASRNDSLAENLPEQLADKERELRDVDDGISALNDEITVLNKQGDTRAKLSLKKQDRERLSATLNGLYVIFCQNTIFRPRLNHVFLRKTDHLSLGTLTAKSPFKRCWATSLQLIVWSKTSKVLKSMC
jgi:hypothetical protein